MKNTNKITIAITLFFLGWFSHQYIEYLNGDNYTKYIRLIRENSSEYNFTNPLLFIDNANATFTELDSLKAKIKIFKSETLARGEAEEVSVYFRDLVTTRWTGIDEDKLYDPASMQKVVLLVAYLRSVESDPSILNKKLYYSGSVDDENFYTAEHLIHKGGYYSVKDLIVDMIIKSGNDSTQALFDSVDKNELARIYGDLGFTIPVPNKPELISAKIYSRLFRVLYSSTYLDRNLSEEVLSLLSQTEFDLGLKALLPESIKVSHKFGERTIKNQNGEIEKQLHDCGIIYYPEHPYFLCVMSKGKDFNGLQKVISQISKITYDYWDSVEK